MEMVAAKDIYKGFDGVEVLRGVSLSVHKGEVVAIIGPSGSGKSTLLRCLNRLERVDRGEIAIEGETLCQPDGEGRAQYVSEEEVRRIRRKLGMVFQSFNLFPHLSVLENLTLAPVHVLKMDKGTAEAQARELLGKVGLADRGDAYPYQLSGGQAQRVAIARALASNPEMLLCDEATSALDPMTTQSILELLKKINAELGITVVLITHEMAVIRQICNKVAILDGGKLVEQGTVDDVFMHTKSAAGKRLFGILPENEDDVPAQPALRIVFDGAAADQPIISRLVKDLGFDVNILAADMHQFNGKTYGQMMVARPEDPAELKQVQDYLAKAGLTTEEVSGQ